MTATPTDRADGHSNENECPRCQITTTAVTCPNCGLRLIAQPSTPATAHTAWQDSLHSGSGSQAHSHAQTDYSSHRTNSDPQNAWYFFPGNYFQTYIHRLKKILTDPTGSFHSLPVSHKPSSALAFALVTNWAASLLSFFWSSLFGAAFLERIMSYAQLSNVRGGHAILSWFMGMGSVLLDPFITLISVVFTSFMVFLGAKLIISPETQSAPRAVTFESTLKVICYGMTPMILSAIPVVGGVASGIGVFAYTIIGIKEYYRTSTGRSVFVVLFPKLIFLVVVTSIVTLGIGLVAGLVGSMVR